MSEPDVIEIDTVTPRAQDIYHWIAVYDDHSELREYEEDGTEHGWRDVDLSRLRTVMLMPQVDGIPGHAMQMRDSEDVHPAFFRRRTMNINLESGDQTYLGSIHVLGMVDERQGTCLYTAIYPDGSVLVTDDPDGF